MEMQTTAMVVILLTSLKQRCNNNNWYKYKNTLTALMSYYSEDDGACISFAGGK